MSVKKKKSSKKKVAKPYSKKLNKKQINTETETPKFETAEITPKETPRKVTEKAPLFPFLFRRVLEFLIPSLVLSFPTEIIRYIKAPDSFFWGIRLSIFTLLIFIIISIYLYRVFFFSIGNKKVYFRVNIASYTIFALITFLILKIPNTEELYSFIFMPMNYVSYLLCDIFNGIYAESYRIQSTFLTHIFMYLMIFISPLEMYGIEKKLQKRSK